MIPVKPLSANTKKEEMAQYLIYTYQRVADEEKAIKKVFLCSAIMDMLLDCSS
jgi:hypothetical protein